MQKYRKRPVVVEAMQYDGTAECATDIINWALSYDVTIRYYCRDGDACRADRHTLKVMTLEGAMEAKPGWWVIKGIENEFYPCEPDIFNGSYDEAVDEDMQEMRDRTKSDIASAYGFTASDMDMGAVPHEDKEHPATGNEIVVQQKQAHDPLDANCVKHVQGEPSLREAVCIICTAPKIVHPRGRRS